MLSKQSELWVHESYQWLPTHLPQLRTAQNFPIILEVKPKLPSSFTDAFFFVAENLFSEGPDRQTWVDSEPSSELQTVYRTLPVKNSVTLSFPYYVPWASSKLFSPRNFTPVLLFLAISIPCSSASASFPHFLTVSSLLNPAAMLNLDYHRPIPALGKCVFRWQSRPGGSFARLVF